MKAFIITRDETEGGACESDALAYVNGDGVIQIEQGGEVMQLCGAREARLVAYRLCKAAEYLEENYSNEERTRVSNRRANPGG